MNTGSTNDNVIVFPKGDNTALRLPRLIGHRGARAYAPENTLASLHTAADMGVEWVELDVKLSRDGEPIIFHDETLERVTGASGLVADMDWKDLKELDAGAHFSNSFVDERIPHLEQALDVIIDRGIGLNLEIKPCPGREKETAEIALDWLSRSWPDDVPPPIISSFQLVSLEMSLMMIPEYPRGYLISPNEEQTVDNWQKKAEHLDVKTLNFDLSFFKDNPEMVKEFLDTDYTLMCFTVNDLSQAEELFDMGVTSIFSDMPDLLD